MLIHTCFHVAPLIQLSFPQLLLIKSTDTNNIIVEIKLLKDSEEEEILEDAEGAEMLIV